jgi:hypothetical protein
MLLGIDFLSSCPGAGQAITTELDKLKDYFVQHDPSCTDFPLPQVEGGVGQEGNDAMKKVAVASLRATSKLERIL